jgi:hypothetical protein
VLLTTDADLAGAVLHAKSSGLKVIFFVPSVIIYLIAGCRATNYLLVPLD